MATNDIKLIDFIHEKQQSLSSLSGDELDLLLHEIKYRYPTTFDEIQNSKILSNINDSGKLKADLAVYFKTLEKLPNQLLEERQDLSVLPDEITLRTVFYREAKQRTQEHIENKRTTAQQARETYARRLGKNFTEQVQTVLQKEADNHIVEEARRASSNVSAVDSPEAAHRLERSIVDTLQASEKEKNEILNKLEADVREERNDFLYKEDLFQRTNKTLAAAQETLLTDPSPPISTRKFIDITASLLETTDISAEAAITHAGRSTRAIETNMIDASGVSPGGHGFFQKVASSGNYFEQRRAGFADFVFDRLGPNEQIAALRGVFTQSLDRIEKTTLGAGQFLAESQMLKNALRVGDERASPRSVGTAVQKVTSDFFQTFHGVDAQTLLIVQTIHAQSLSGDWMAAENSKMLMMQMLYSGGERLLHTAFEKSGKWTLKKGAAATAGKAGTSLLTKLLAGAGTGTAVGGPLGTIVGLVGSFLTDIVLSKLMSVGAATFGAVTQGLNFFASGKFITSPDSSSGVGLLAAAVIIGALAILFIFPTVLNIQGFPEDMRQCSLATSLVGGGIKGPARPGAPEGEVVIWSYAGDAPVSEAPPTASPVNGGSCTQGPYESFSHSGTKAYDLANAQGADVFATHNGYVVSYRDDIPPYTFINHSYGNYVLLVGQTSNREKFFTMYAHLLTVTDIVRAAKTAIGDPILITKGTIIGTEDATGSTYGGGPNDTGIHLHYGYQGPGELSLPYACQ